MEGDARAFAPVNSESKDLTVTDAADALSRDFQNESGPVESRTPAVKEKAPDLPTLSDDTKISLKDGTELALRELKRGYARLLPRKPRPSLLSALALAKCSLSHSSTPP